MIDIDAVVQDSDHDAVTLCRTPRLFGLDYRKMPLCRDRRRCLQATLEFRNEIRKCKYDLVHLGQLVSQLDHPLRDIFAAGIERNQLIRMEGIVLPYLQPVLVQHSLLFRFRNIWLEPDYDFAIDHTQVASRIVKHRSFDLVRSGFGTFRRRGVCGDGFLKSLRYDAICNDGGATGRGAGDWRTHRLRCKRECSDAEFVMRVQRNGLQFEPIFLSKSQSHETLLSR